MEDSSLESGRYFEDFQVGQTFSSSHRLISKTDLDEFAKISGDYNPLHIDEEFARNARFGQRIAQGVLSLSILTGFWDELHLWRETVEAFYGINKLRFIKPVFIGDSIHAKMTVISKEPKNGNGLLTLANEMLNQKDELVMVCETLLLIGKRSSASVQ